MLEYLSKTELPYAPEALHARPARTGDMGVVAQAGPCGERDPKLLHHADARNSRGAQPNRWLNSVAKYCAVEKPHCNDTSVMLRS